jgi:hypothetical protein
LLLPSVYPSCKEHDFIVFIPTFSAHFPDGYLWTVTPCFVAHASLNAPLAALSDIDLDLRLRNQFSHQFPMSDIAQFEIHVIGQIEISIILAYLWYIMATVQTLTTLICCVNK